MKSDASALDTQIAGANKLKTFSLNPQIRHYIESNSIKIPECGCWIWDRSLTVRGCYGQVGYRTYGTEKAHRLSYVAYKGADDMDNMFVCHTCDVAACVNPFHLFLGSAMDNHLDMVKKGRGNYARIAKTYRKLTADEVRKIRVEDGTQLSLAAKYGVSGGTIGQIRRCTQYKDIL